MTFPILGGNGAVGTYSIDNSLRFNDGDSPKLALSSFSPLYTFSSGTWSLWLKRSHLGTDQYFFSSHVQGGGDNKGVMLRWTNDYKIRILVEDGSNYLTWETSALFRDVSAWYHIHVTYSGSNIMDESNWTLKVNGVTQSGTVSKSGSQSSITLEGFAIGARYANSAYYLDGYATEYYFIDGSVVDVSNFAEADEDSGIWKPISYSGSYGSKGFYLDFEDSGSLGADQSGNGNNFTPTNLASTDQTTDTPTNNWCTLNPLANQLGTALSEGNLQQSDTGNDKNCFSTFGLNTGKWYFEVKAVSVGTRGNILITDADHNEGLGTNYARVQLYDGAVLTSATDNGNLSVFSNGDILCVALDLDNGQVWFSKNANINTGTTALVTNLPLTGTNRDYRVSHFGTATGTTVQFNFGNPPFSISSGNTDDNGYGNFEYAPPTGYLSLCSVNLATVLSPTIDDGSQYFNTVTYAGTSSTQSITGVGFQPDFTWGKNRSITASHLLYDSTRGAGYYLISNATSAEAGSAGLGFDSFDSDGFTLDGTSGYLNNSGSNYVTWNWKANGGTTSSNTDGTITSTVQANTTAGFSIVTYTGTGANATIGHGLGKVPAMIITKTRDNADNWGVYHQGVDATAPQDYYLPLNLTNARIDVSTTWNDTAPTSSVFSVGTNGVSNDTGGMVAYCFAEIEGYSKFGSYTGNGSSDGTFVYTGFRPAWVMIRRYNNGGNWKILDNKRANTYNVIEYRLEADLSDAEKSTSSHYTDFVSNGFKLRGSSLEINGNGYGYIYMAFAESPFVTSTSIPVTAR